MSAWRTFFYLPAIMPAVAASLLWLWMFQPTHGLLNRLLDITSINALLRQLPAVLKFLHLSVPITWLQSEYTSKPALILMGLWGAGGGMIIWLAGLQGVPQHLYEAAEIDGATAWHKFWHVTIPMLSPTIFFNLIMGTIGALQTFETVYVVTGGSGGPLDSTLVPVLYLFNSAFRFFKMGFASALAWLMFWIILILTLIQIALAPRWVHYEGK
jgi:multiple sugar transport system permease protein